MAITADYLETGSRFDEVFLKNIVKGRVQLLTYIFNKQWMSWWQTVFQMRAKELVIERCHLKERSKIIPHQTTNLNENCTTPLHFTKYLESVSLFFFLNPSLSLSLGIDEEGISCCFCDDDAILYGQVISWESLKIPLTYLKHKWKCENVSSH